jgi:transposase-like protein
MGKRSYRRYEAAFKSQLIEQIQSGQLSASEAAREHRISRSLIARWRDQYLGKGLVEKPSIRERQLETENAKLKAKVADLVMEMDHIKKLQAWVQQKKSADTSVITSKNWDQFRKPAK